MFYLFEFSVNFLQRLTIFLPKVLGVCAATGNIVHPKSYICRFGVKTFRFASHVPTSRDDEKVRDIKRDILTKGRSSYSQLFCVKLCCARKACRDSIFSWGKCKIYRKTGGFARCRGDLSQTAKKENSHSNLQGKKSFSFFRFMKCHSRIEVHKICIEVII